MTQPATFATRQHLRLDLFLPAADWEGFDRLEIWRARTSEAGPYECLHDKTWAPARLPVGFVGTAAGSGPSVFLVGKTLEFTINESVPVEITFTGSDPLTYAQAATQIAAQSLGLLSSFVSGSTLVVETIQAGVLATLRCTGGDAAPTLKLPTVEPGALAFGRDARIVLTAGHERYGFVDPDGLSTYLYKTRLYNSQTELTSEFSTPFKPRRSRALPAANMVRCYVDLVDPNGNPAHNVEVLLYTRYAGVQVDARTVTSSSQRLLTDADGHAEALIVRGTEVGVSVGGTSLARNVKVPDDPTVEALNLLAPENGTDDLFAVQIPDLPFAVRRTM